MAQQQIGFVEKYALAAERSDALKQLVPGTEDYYYFHALHYQHTDQLKKVDEILKPWYQRFGNTQRYKTIKNRQALLKLNSQPGKTFEYLINELSPNLNHQREIPRTEQNLPSRLDPKLISMDRLINEAIRRKKDSTDRFESSGLIYFPTSKLNTLRRRHLLTRLTTPDFPELVDLIAKDLKSNLSGGFGSLTIHNQLTIDQLDACIEKIPGIKDNQNFVFAYISRLQPGADENWEADRKVHHAYLDQLWTFVKDLAPTFNSLKACILFRKLELNRLDGKYDRKLFVEYLKLPKRTNYVSERMYQDIRSKYIVNLSQDYRSHIRLMPVHNDLELVRDYLHRFLKSANSFADFSPYLAEWFLKEEYASVKILNGMGNVEKWASMLGPSKYRALIDRVDLEFMGTNTEFFGDDDGVEIGLFTKNIDKLIVKVYEINTFNYYRKHKKEIDTDINLDGLVPNSEKTYTYNEAPALRKQRLFKFDELSKPGVYVIDFIAGGTSSRALVRRGRLSMVGQPTVAGQSFVVFDQNRKPVLDATLWIAGARYVADKMTGAILIPYSSQASRRQAIITHGSFSSLQSFDQLPEQYHLNAGIYLDRESLIAGKKTSVMIRPSLRINSLPSSVDFLEDIQLAISSVDLDGQSNTKRLKGIELNDDQESTVEFMVPPRSRQLSIELRAKIKNISRNQTQDLVISRSYEINSIDRTDEIQDVHLMPTQSGYFLELRGKTGEIRKHQAVRLKLKHRFFKDPINVNLQSDDSGLIELGELANIENIRATIVGGSTRSWYVNRPSQTYWDSVHGVVGEPIQIPKPADVEETNNKFFTLFEKRGNRFYKNYSNKIQSKNGLFLLKDLPAGDFVFFLHELNRAIDIRITDGDARNMVALGKHRQLEVRNPDPLYVKNTNVSDKDIEIQLGNASRFSRVHLIASRYHPRFDSFAEFSRVRDVNPWIYKPAIRRSVYMAGRVIGDEYQYILDRKYAHRYPGNMLERPSLLLAPWAWRDTNNNIEQLKGGTEFSEAGMDADSKLNRKRANKRGGNNNSDFANLDFLPVQETITLNLVPDKDGKITVDREKIGDRQFVRVIAVDHQSTVERRIRLERTTTKLRDLRLAHSLNPDKHFSQTKAIEVINKDKSLTIDDLVSAKFQQFDDLADVYRLFLMVNANTELANFEFLLTWSDKNDAEKQELYSKFVCHELNYYLMKKDKDFFKRVVFPHLQNKRERTFMDEYLLGNRLESYLHSSKFSKLNTFERILLSQSLEEQSADIIRNLLDRYMLTPTSVTQFDRLYDFSIQSNQLLATTMDPSGAVDEFVDAEAMFFSKQQQPQQLELPALESASKGMSGKKTRRTLADPGDGSGDKAGRPMSPKKLAELANQKNQARERLRQLGGERDSTRSSFGRVGGQGGLGGGGGGGFGYADDAFEARKEDALRLREQAKALFRRLPPTREWIEHNYYHIGPGTATNTLVQPNRFWRDFASHSGGTFLNPYFAECNRSFTEMMFALAVLDLPEKATEHELEYADGSMTIKAGSSMIAFHQQVRPAELNAGNTTILVSENFYQKNDRYRHDDQGIQYDKFINEKFYAHTLYGGQVVVTNPTSTPRLVELLVQIPKGSVATAGSQPTKTTKLQLGAFQTSTFDYFFYFPTAGDFDHYPAHVSNKDKVLAVASPVSFKVTDEPLELDKSSWQYVSQNGSSDEVIDFISNSNVLRLDLEKIAFRMKDKTFFERAIKALQNRYVYNHSLWAYALKHKNLEILPEFLKNAHKVSHNVGPHFDSEILNVRAFENLWHEHREYSPLVNARFHGLGHRREILNPQFHQQYHRLLNVLAHKPDLEDDDNLVVTYYMLLQDRITEALAHFEQVKKSNVDTAMQYDYCAAYIDMYREQPEQAAAKAEKWVSYPVDLWRNRFKDVLAQVEEIRGGDTSVIDDKNQSQMQTKMAANAPSFDFSINGQSISVDAQNISELTMNLYEMDIELLFSRNPFARDQFDGFSIIRPNSTRKVVFETKKGSKTIDVPKDFVSKNVLIEFEAGDQIKSKPYFANSMAVQVIEKYGQLRVTEKKGNRPVAKTYVKVYAKASDGQIRFHKDGYTDLRGRFDYVSQSNNPLDNVAEYSVLVLSPEYGAIVRQVSPPAE